LKQIRIEVIGVVGNEVSFWVVTFFRGVMEITECNKQTNKPMKLEL
jgi:hypothetical protein